MPAYLLREGEGKAVAIYSRCEDELLCRAELLVMLGEVAARVPPALVRGPVRGYYDVDPTCSRQEFLKSYEKDPTKHERLMSAKRAIVENGWDFPDLD